MNQKNIIWRWDTVHFLPKRRAKETRTAALGELSVSCLNQVRLNVGPERAMRKTKPRRRGAFRFSGMPPLALGERRYGTGEQFIRKDGTREDGMNHDRYGGKVDGHGCDGFLVLKV